MRSKTLIRFAIATSLTALVLPLAGCDEDQPPTAVQTLEQKAHQAAEEAAAATVDAHEIKMIQYRRRLMGKPGLQLYVIFLNDMGQPIDYFVTTGKCTSSNKRLINPTRFAKGDKGSYYGYFAVPAPGDDGTFGDSDEYIYCKTADGKYKQWNGDYLISDAPLEITIKPLVIDVVKPGQSGIQHQQ